MAAPRRSGFFICACPCFFCAAHVKNADAHILCDAQKNIPHFFVKKMRNMFGNMKCAPLFGGRTANENDQRE